MEKSGRSRWLMVKTMARKPLTDLEPEWTRFETRNQEVEVIVGDHATWRERGCPTQKVMRDVEYHIDVDNFAEAQGVQFLCPKCFAKNGGHVGTHLILVPFRDRGVLDNQGMHDENGNPVRWAASGTSFKDLTIDPSIWIKSGCQWHGCIENGETKDA